MEEKRLEREPEIKHEQDTSESGDLSVPHHARYHTERLPDTPLAFEEQRRRFGGAEAAADAQLEKWDENHLEAAVGELRQIKCLDPERWKNAAPEERKWALIEANRVIGKAFNWGAVDLEFKEMDNDKLGETTKDGSHIWLNQKFLASDDPSFDQSEHPSWALGTVCHEYRHFYQEENAHALHGPIRPDVTESVTRQWERGRANYVPGDDLDQDSDSLADRLCRKFYGEASEYR